MKRIDVKEGIYVLSETIKNPNPDRRQKYDWTDLPVWGEEGSRFAILYDVLDSEKGKQPWTLFHVYRVHGMGRSSRSLRFLAQADGSIMPVRSCSPKKDAATMALLAALKPSTTPLDEFCWAFFEDWSEPDSSSCRVLLQLFRAGKITTADIRLALAACHIDDKEDK